MSGGPEDVGAPLHRHGSENLKSFPATPMQLGLLFETMALDRPWTNLEQIVIGFDADLEVEHLREAWRIVVTRHEALRSRFVWPGAPDVMQVVEPSATVDLVEHDWRSHESPRAELETWLATDRSCGVDPTSESNQRLNLFRLDESEAVLVWTFHHAFLDGRSFALVLEEVVELYEALADGRTAELGDESTSPAAHAHAVAARDVRQELDHFEALLGRDAEPSILPWERPPGTGNDDPTEHEVVELNLAPDVGTGLRRLAEETDTTVYTAVLVAWATVLMRSTGRDDAIFGSTRSGRSLVDGADAAVGCLINTVAVRVQLDADESIRSALRRCRADLIAGRPFEQASLDDVQTRAGCSSEAPLLTTNVMFERYALESRLAGPDSAGPIRRLEVREEGAFPITLAIYDDESPRLELEFDPSMFPALAMERMLHHVARILGEFAMMGADATIGDLRMLSDDEFESLVDLGGSPDRIDDVDLLVGFDEAVRRHGDSLAIHQLEDGREVTYLELDRMVEGLAAALVELGVAERDRVVLHLPRSIEYVAAMIATLRVGGAFVPVDPGYPRDAVTHILTDARPSAMISSRTGREVTEQLDIPVVLIDQLVLDAPMTPSNRPSVGQDDPAYVIYTSGSTGPPKGVMISRGSLVAHQQSFTSLASLAPSDRVLQTCSQSFDASIEEIIPTLWVGASLWLRSDEMGRSMGEFLDVLERRRLTVLNLPTAYWHELVRHLDGPGLLPECVRLNVIGGETASLVALRKWMDCVPQAPVLNMYGPTECTIDCTTFRADATLSSGLSSVPIGHTYGAARAYVVDPHGDLSPRGSQGELWIGGPCVGLGYHNLPELTARRFRSDPFVAGERVYRTGDRVRWNDSDELEFLGRQDRQIKLRGFRVEPVAIEQVLEAHPTVDRAVVAARGTGSGARLIAWVVPATAGSTPSHEVRERLLGSLPAYMVPDSVVDVDELPVTPGGKIDMRALPEPFEVDAEQVTSDGPVDLVEAKLGETFREVLDVDRLGMDDDFFALGGSSLRAVRLLSEIERQFARRITFPTLMAAPTPAALADVLRGADVAQYNHLRAIQPLGSKTPIFGIHVLGENASFYRPLSERLGEDRPVFGLGLTTLDRLSDAAPDVAAIAAEYVSEIRACASDAPVAIAGISLGSVVAFEVASQLREQGVSVVLVALLDSLGPDASPLSIFRRARLHAERLGSLGPRHIGNLVKRRRAALREQLDLIRIRIDERSGRELSDEHNALRVVRTNLRAQQAFSNRSYDGAVALFRAEFEASSWMEGERCGWADVASGAFEVVDVPGDHMSILQEPHVEHLALEFERVLHTLETKPGSGDEDT